MKTAPTKTNFRFFRYTYMNCEKRALLIINPISGTLSKEGLEERVRAALEPSGFNLECVVTTHPGHASALASEAADRGFYAVIAAGGDGTVNEVGSAIADSSTTLGILPFGSGNGLARHLLTSIDVDNALKVIARDCPLNCDYGSANGHKFFCTFGMGFDATVSREFANMPGRGIVTYLKSALSQWLTYKPVQYEINAFDGQNHHSVSVKAFIVAICNASQYGNNAFIAPKASVCDGMLDVVVIHSGNQLSRALAGAQLFTGRIDKNLLIETFRIKEAEIKRFPGPAHIDGEPCMMPETVRVETAAGKIKLFTDPDKQPFRPFVTPLESMREDSSFLMRESLTRLRRRIKG